MSSTPTSTTFRDGWKSFSRQAGFAGRRVCVRSVALAEREEWIAEHAPQLDVVISHPRLVETGLDLFDKGGRHNFPTLCFYETGYNLFTLRQASRRSWRIGQEASLPDRLLPLRRHDAGPGHGPDGQEADRGPGPGRQVLQRRPGGHGRRRRQRRDRPGPQLWSSAWTKAMSAGCGTKQSATRTLRAPERSRLL